MKKFLTGLMFEPQIAMGELLFTLIVAHYTDSDAISFVTGIVIIVTGVFYASRERRARYYVVEKHKLEALFEAQNINLTNNNETRT